MTYRCIGGKAVLGQVNILRDERSQNDKLWLTAKICDTNSESRNYFGRKCFVTSYHIIELEDFLGYSYGLVDSVSF